MIEQAKSDPNKVLLCEDEMTFTSQVTIQKVWYEKGAILKVTEKQKRQRIHFYGFWDYRTKKALVYKSNQENSEETVVMLKKIIHIILIKKLYYFGIMPIGIKVH